MGMFDYVRCARIMPDGVDGASCDFQTKDFDNPDMDVYEITSDGRLIGGPEGFDGSTYHGFLEFYDIVSKGEEQWWHSYRAKFSAGTLVALALDGTCRLTSDKE